MHNIEDGCVSFLFGYIKEAQVFFLVVWFGEDKIDEEVKRWGRYV